jgi:hypothetical protein
MAHSAAAFSINAIGITPNADQAERVRTRTLNHAGGDVQLAVGDFSDPTSLEGALEGVDAVFSPAETCRNQVDAPVAFRHWHALIERHLHASMVPAVTCSPGSR